jgi:hypothetical protein
VLHHFSRIIDISRYLCLDHGFCHHPTCRSKSLFPSSLLLRHFTSKNPNIDKEIYRPSKVQGDRYDVIVIGSGIGGLTAASLLAQAGKKALWYEGCYDRRVAVCSKDSGCH